MGIGWGYPAKAIRSDPTADRAKEPFSGTSARLGRLTYTSYAGRTMQFSDADLDELREIYRADFHEEITREQAAEIGERLLRLFSILLRPLKDDRQTPESPGH